MSEVLVSHTYSSANGEFIVRFNGNPVAAVRIMANSNTTRKEKFMGIISAALQNHINERAEARSNQGGTDGTDAQ